MADKCSLFDLQVFQNPNDKLSEVLIGIDKCSRFFGLAERWQIERDDVVLVTEKWDYFSEAETDSIEEALAELGESEYTEEEVRLMRIKFLSEVGN